MDCGRAAYGPTLDLQKKLLREVQLADDERAYLLLVEHEPAVITLGRRAKAEHLLASRERLAAMGIELAEASRGGDITYHGPGQLVGYPILHLAPGRRPVHAYIRNLEESLIRLLERFGIEGRRIGGKTGVWVGDEKVAAIGIAVSRWTAYHGFALNVATDLSAFDLIVPCGIRGARVTSLERLTGRAVAIEEVKPPLVECLAEVLGFGPITQVRPS
jgi:lipoyl(octanoyl) transferase